MSKILIEGNKVIIDGHANDLETCNTLTNLCDELSTSEKFRTVKYESGYGEFESVVENEEKKFPARTSIFIYYNDGTVAFIDNEVLLASNIEVTSTGLKIDNELRYIYDGNKVFLGFSDKANSTSATFPIGYKCSTEDMPINPKEEGKVFYIVEGIVIPEHHSSLNELFTNIATVIREKTGDTDSIVADDFPDVIRERLQVIPPPAYLTFSSPSSFTLAVNDTTKHWNGTLEYSTDTSTWSTWDGATTLSSATSGSDNVLYLRGTGNTVITGNKNTYKWVLTGSNIVCIGNIENLLDYVTVESGAHPTMRTYCYSYMFRDCTALTQAPALPATTLASDCYSQMFYGCTSLTQAPALPATTLASNCYTGMFQGCTSLTQAPALPATTLVGYCYIGMFQGCTSLTQAPALPATTLANNCYTQMFTGCARLTQAPALPATTLADRCYDNMFNGCVRLTQAPALPATTLAPSCYQNMFFRCVGLKLSSTQTGEYTVAYRIPITGTGTTADTALTGMFSLTGGTFTGTPEINTTYYLSNTNTVVG